MVLGVTSYTNPTPKDSFIHCIMQLNFPWIYPVRVVQVVFGIIVLGLAAYGRLSFFLPSSLELIVMQPSIYP